MEYVIPGPPVLHLSIVSSSYYSARRYRGEVVFGYDIDMTLEGLLLATLP